MIRLLKSVFWMLGSMRWNTACGLLCTETLNSDLNTQLWTFISPDYQGEYYGPGGNYDYYPPSSQAQTPGDLGYVPSSGPAGTPLGTMDLHHSGHHPSGEGQCFGEMVPHHPGDSPSPEHSISADVSGAFTAISSLAANGYSSQLSQPSSEMSEGTVW